MMSDYHFNLKKNKKKKQTVRTIIINKITYVKYSEIKYFLKK